MSIAIIIIQIVIILGIAFLSYYFQEKGKNLATKEDISEITTKIEQVKHEYSSKLESVKSVLSARLFAHQVRYQKEFDMLVKLSEKLYKFRDALIDVEFHVASLGVGVGVDNPDNTRKIIEKAIDAMGALQGEYEAHLPFYPKDIYDNVQKMHSLGTSKFIVQLDKANLTKKNKISEMITKMSKNHIQRLDTEKMSEAIEKIHKAIRERVEYWEQLNIE